MFKKISQRDAISMLTADGSRWYYGYGQHAYESTDDLNVYVCQQSERLVSKIGELAPSIVANPSAHPVRGYERTSYGARVYTAFDNAHVGAELRIAKTEWYLTAWGMVCLCNKWTNHSGQRHVTILSYVSWRYIVHHS